MPKNKGKGGKNRKRGKNEAEDEKRELVFKEDGQEYAQVLRMLGNGRCEALCIDGTKRLCHIRGKMHKKVWIASGDIILVGLRDYQDDKADVILKYQPDEARLLKAYGELPENVRLNEGIAGGMDEEEDGGGDDYIEFEDEDIDRIWPKGFFLSLEKEGKKEKKKKNTVSPIQQTSHRIACKNCHSRVYLCRQLHYLLRLQIFFSF